ncbi:MAG: hypothetical protein HCA25_01705 [Dolichospermum sp. DET50]|nr:hypothetical protein [Dolichospermum sp. DET66]MBS3031026.1 hypothetical protein [Dolichospermum sp. DET67]MBS3036236.1 hypothetical protein [Dolichospermum sp. DET50]QSX68300.1 MAG: hypothetical protein EZY12_00875 [Dolichospermum sp. DET69]
MDSEALLQAVHFFCGVLLIKQLEEIGCIFIRHREINENLAKHILKMLENS